MNEKLAYLEKLETQISDAQEHLNTLKANKEQVLIEAQHEEIEILEEHLAKAQINLKEIFSAAEDSWYELKGSLDQTMHMVSESIDKLLRSMS